MSIIKQDYGELSGGVDFDITRCVFDANSHSGSSFTMSCPSKPIVVFYSYIYGSTPYFYISDFNDAINCQDLTFYGASFIDSYDESTKVLTLKTASTSSLSYKITVFY